MPELDKAQFRTTTSMFGRLPVEQRLLLFLSFVSDLHAFYPIVF